MSVCEQPSEVHFPHPEARERAERAFRSFAVSVCSDLGRTWDEVAAELAGSGFGPAQIPARIRSGWVSVDPDPARFTLGPHPARRGELLLPRGVLRRTQRFVGSLSHPAGGRGNPARRLHPLAWLRSRGQDQARSA